MSNSVLIRPGGTVEYSELVANFYRGCSHGCAYCYAPAAQFRRDKKLEFHTDISVRKNVLAVFERECMKYPEKNHSIMFSDTCDPYQPIEGETGVTRTAIQIAHKQGFGVKILSKGGLLACRDFNLLTHPLDEFGCTLTFLNTAASRRWEPGAASPGERLAALQEAHMRGIKTWVSLEPVIDPEATLELIEMCHGFVDVIRIGKLNHWPEIEKRIDWLKFRYEAVALCEKLKAKYLLKHQLIELKGKVS